LIHGEKYDYSRTRYKNSKSKVELICLRCGISVYVTPNDHLSKKSGCRCWRSMSLADIQAKCLRNLGSSITCHAVRSGKHMREVDLECALCGRRWWSQISSVNQSKGCLTCNRLKPRSWDEALAKFVAVHGERYQHDPISYTKWHGKINVKCLSCQSNFTIMCVDHAKGQGCVGCHKRCKVDTEEFVRRAKQMHGDAYDYSRVNYADMMSKVDIRCVKCGSWFKQLPNNHVNIGNGCPACASAAVVSKLEAAWLDSLQISVEDRQVTVTIDDASYVVDALCGDTVYEFYGSYWHGDPRATRASQIIGRRSETASELYAKTLSRQSALERKGYMVKYVWEWDHLAGATFSCEHPSTEGWFSE
jgi:hypothetical protein